MKKILITGGAGYIGSHMVMQLLEAGYHPVVVDDLSVGNNTTVPENIPLYVFNIGEKAKLDAVFKKEKIAAVMHFAASTDVGESVKTPLKYYRNNVTNTLSLLDCMLKHQVRNFIFSSTAAIFGSTQQAVIAENHPQNPINPYGQSKAICEQVLANLDAAYGLKSVCLRYFNAAGANPLKIKPQNNTRKNLIPVVIEVARGKRPHIEVFGHDYDTPDGTCIRDYIHVMDLCQAHLLALEYLEKNGRSACYNLGNGHGYSVAQVILAAEKITQKPIPIIKAVRRPGDSPKVIADAQLARKELGWSPQFCDIETMIEHEWQWQ